MEYTERTELLNTIGTQIDDTEGSYQNVTRDPRVFCFSGDKWKVFSAGIHCLVQTLIGSSVCVTLWFAFKSTPIGAFQLHVGLSVIGYQLIMAHGILCLHSSVWSGVGYKYRRRLHWMLQIGGSIFAIAGSVVMIKEKKSHFVTMDGKLALAALIFTCVSFINGLTSLYAVELRRFIPAKVSKISHIILGTAAFALSSTSLAYGYNKSGFKKWATEEFAYVMTGVVSINTFIVVATTCIKITYNSYQR